MTNTKILEEVHRRLDAPRRTGETLATAIIGKDGIVSFIEQEWQKQDEQELVDQHNRNRKAKDHITDVSEISDQYSTIGLENMADTTYSQHWYGDGCSSQQVDGDAQEIERHRGLVIGEDGTVEEIK